MAVHARGYRSYDGGFTNHAPALAIFREGHRVAFAGKGFRIVGVLLLIVYVVTTAILYASLNFNELISQWNRSGEEFDYARTSAEMLAQFLVVFCGIAGTLGALVALLSGAGIVADDLRTKALPLYLVRPLRPSEYMLGKALILPTLLLWFMLIPGLSFFFFAGLWQPTGTAGEWWAANGEIAWTVIRHYLAASTGLTGLMLLLSSRFAKRGSVRGIAAAVIFGGGMFAGFAMQSRGIISDVIRYTGVMGNSTVGFTLLSHEYGNKNVVHFIEYLPDPNIGLAVNVALLAVGLWCTWNRARSAEVSA